MVSLEEILLTLKGITISSEGRRLSKELLELNRNTVSVGFQQGSTYPDGTEVVDVAAWNEFGTSTIPQRPFMRNTLDNNEDDIRSFVSQQVQSVVNGGTAEDALKQTGIYVKGLMQEEIRNGSFTPNAPSTIAKKGSSKPLIDTGLMRQSVNYQVRKKGSGNS